MSASPRNCKVEDANESRDTTRRKRRGRAAAACLSLGVLGTVMAGCGGGSSTGSAGGGGSNGKVTITEMDSYPNGLPQYGAFQWLFSTYEKTHPNVKIQRETVAGTEILPKLLSEAQTRTLPDLAVPIIQDMPNLEATGQFASISPYLSKWGQWNDYMPASRGVVTNKGQVYGIQIGTNDLGIFYNKKVFAKAGVHTIPKTWAQLESVSKQLVTHDPGLTYGAIGYGADCTEWQMAPYYYSQGININQLTSPKMVAAVNLWVNLLKGGLANKEVITQCQSTNIPQFVQGKLAMVEDGPWDLPTLAADHFSDWGTFTIPVATAGEKPSSPLGGEAWAVPKTSSASEQAAWNFIKWSQTPKILQEFDNKIGYFSVRPALWPAEEKAEPLMTPFIKELSSSKELVTGLGASFNTYANDLQTAVVQALEGQKSAASALAGAASAAKASLSGGGS